MNAIVRSGRSLRLATIAAAVAVALLVAESPARAQDDPDSTSDMFAPGGPLNGFVAVPGGEDAYVLARPSGRVGPSTVVTNVGFTLTTSNGKYPLYGVMVALQGAGGTFKATTGLNGTAVFPAVPAGTYNFGLIGLPLWQTPKNAPKTVSISKSGNTVITTAFTPGGGRNHEWLLFGDSNSIPLPPEVIGFDVFLNQDHTFANAMSYTLNEVDFALGNTPIAQFPDCNYGLAILTAGEAAHPAAPIALIRYGINDVHRYLAQPSSSDVSKFSTAYTQAVQTTIGHGTLPVLFTLMKETDTSYDSGFDAGNNVIKGLASSYHLPLVVANIDARHNPQYFKSDGIHNSDLGNEYLLSLMDQTLIKYFTTGSLAPH